MSQSKFDRRKLIAGGAALGVAGIAVGGMRGAIAQGDGDDEATPGASPMASPGASPAASPMAGGQEHIVEMNDQLEFVPDDLTIKVGDTVTWVTVGAIPHTSTCDPEKANNPEDHVQLPEGAETWDSGIVNQDEEFSHTFEVPGGYTYFCIPHEAAGMIASLTVEE